MGETNAQMYERLGIKLGDQKRPRQTGRVKPPKPRRDYPGEMMLAFTARGWPAPVREHQFHGVRRWRMDLAWVEAKIAVECHGGVYSGGRHVRGGGFTRDREKMNSAAEMGWRVIEVACPHQMGLALDWIESALRDKGLIDE